MTTAKELLDAATPLPWREHDFGTISVDADARLTLYAVNRLPDSVELEEAVERLQKWIDPYVDGYHSSCDLDRGYDYAECSCGLDERLDAVRAALARLRSEVPA